MEDHGQIWSVDDDEDMSQAIGLMVKLLGFKFRNFDSACPAARALLQGERPLLFLIDINMPAVTGLELLEFIRSRPSLKKLPILMLSANAFLVQVHEPKNAPHRRSNWNCFGVSGYRRWRATDTDVELVMRAGAQGYLIKPVSLEELERGLRLALGYGRPVEAARKPCNKIGNNTFL